VDPEDDARISSARRAIARVRAQDVVTGVAVAVLVFGAVQLFRGAIDVGVTLDEPIHVDRLQSWLDTGWYVQAWLLPDGNPSPDYELANPYVYGPAFAFLGHVANVLVGNEPLGEVSNAAGAYATRHVVVALTALLAVAAVGAACRRLSGSWRVGVWAAAALVAIPRWSGHGFFNPKDIPMASGYTLLTAALVFALYERPGETSARRRLAIASTLALGIYLAAGTRPAIWPALLVSVLAYAALRAGQWRFGEVRRPLGTDLAVAAGVVAGAVAIAAIYPNAARTPFTFLAETVSGSSGYPWEGETLTAGGLVSEHPPWWYLPTWLSATFPILIGALALAGIAITVTSVTRPPRGAKALWSDRRLGASPALLQLLLLPVLATLGGSTFYDGIRQHLYVLPAAAILAGVGAAAAWTWAHAGSARRRAAVAAGLSLALIAPMVQQTILFPYNYTYFNPVARSEGINGRWEADYWYASVDELIARVPRGVTMMCGGLVSAGERGDRATAGPCLGSQYEAYEDRRGTALDADSPAALERPGLWLITGRRNGSVPAPGCEIASAVTRPLLGEDVVMSYLLRCDPDAVEIVE
jgi:hypothetical protein